MADPIGGDRPVGAAPASYRPGRRIIQAGIGLGAIGIVIYLIYLMASGTKPPPPPPPKPPTVPSMEYPVVPPAKYVPPVQPPPQIIVPPPAAPVGKMFEPPAPDANGPNPRLSVFKVHLPAPPEPAKPKTDEELNRTHVAFAGKSLPGTRAGRALNMTYTLLPQILICTLENAIDTTVQGMFFCKLDMDAVSPGYPDAYGQPKPGTSITLMEKGTRVQGLYGNNGGMQQGQHRITATSTMAFTPNGVPVPLDGPIGDELGRAGFSGNVDNHLVERFGAGVLLMLTDNVFSLLNSALQSRNNGSTTNFNLNTGAAQSIASQVLNQTINIPPTLTKNQGEKIGIFVPAPVDFSDAYHVTGAR